MIKQVQNSLFYLLVSKPNLYLEKLIKRTLIIGLISYFISLFMRILDYELSVPTTMHSLIGIVIGLLLVFRTNTAYDRWWEGRKTIGLLSQEINIIGVKLKVLNFDNREANSIKNNVITFLEDLKIYLKQDIKDYNLMEDAVSINKQKELIKYSILVANNSPDGKEIHGSLYNLLSYSSILERIRNSPIPLSYVLHINVSLMIYLLTLPFGLFNTLGLWSTPLVMLVYYIIAGVDIISNEIENPFADDPNDIPTNELFDLMITTLKDEEQ